jgi:hypothetical protein
MGEPFARQRKFRQAAMYYLFLAALYDGVVWQFTRHGLLGPRTPSGPVWVWLALGAAIAALVFYFLWFRQSAWVARVVAVLSVGRLVYLIPDAFLKVHPPPVGVPYAPGRALYVAAFVVVAVNAWLMARAGWDL